MKRYSIMARQYPDIGQCDSHPEAIVAAAQEKCSLRPDSAAESSRRRQWPGDSEQMVARQPETVTLIRPSANSTSAVPKYLTAVKRK
jgi:hypothetical protein